MWIRIASISKLKVGEGMGLLVAVQFSLRISNKANIHT